jgi:tetratricopeptide (TPR) repeat protein
MIDDADTRLNLLLDLRRFREAETLARECLASHPDWAAWHAQLARALFGQKRNEEALAAARTAAGLAPENPWVLANLAWLLSQFDRPSEALEVLQDVLRVDPGYSWGHELLAVANAMLGRKSEWLAAAHKAVELAPEDESAWIQFGWAQVGQKCYSEAIEAAETGLRLHPESAALHNLRGKCLTVQGITTRWPRRFRAFRMAHDSLREALRLNPGESAYADNLLINTVAWRRAAYRVAIWVGLLLLFGVVPAVGYLVIGYSAVGAALLLAVVVCPLWKVLYNPLDHGLAFTRLRWLGLPDVPMTPENRARGRREWLKWAGSIALGLVLVLMLPLWIAVVLLTTPR